MFMSKNLSGLAALGTAVLILAGCPNLNEEDTNSTGPVLTALSMQM
jgi:hypothetical protein